MKITLGALCAILFTLMTSCAPAVNVQKDSAVDFSRFRTYDWAETQVKTTGDKNPIYKSSLADEMIHGAISSELTKKGIRQVSGNTKPDFYITYHLYVDDAERTVSNPPVAGYAYPYATYYRGGLLPINYGGWYSPAYFGRTGYRTETYKEGTLIVDMIDARTNDLAWRGSIADPVNNPASFGEQFPLQPAIFWTNSRRRNHKH